MIFRLSALTAIGALVSTAILSAQSIALPPGAVEIPEEVPKAKPVAGAPQSGVFEVNGIAAKVNGQVITKNEVGFMLAPIAAQLAARYPRHGAEFQKELKAAADKIVQELIDRELILFEFKHELGGKLKPQVVDEEIQRQIRELYNGSEDAFREELKKARMTMDGYRRMTEEKLIVQGMRSRQFADAPPPLPSEVRAEYNAVKEKFRDMSKDKLTFKKIFIPLMVPDPAATPETQLDLAEDIAKQLKDGADFAELAKKYSADAFADQGGQWPETNRVDLSPEFAAILFDSPLNEVIGPLKDPNGFTIAIVTDKKLGPVPPLSDKKVYAEMEARAARKKTAERYERWIKRLRARGMIERNE